MMGWLQKDKKRPQREKRYRLKNLTHRTFFWTTGIRTFPATGTEPAGCA